MDKFVKRKRTVVDREEGDCSISLAKKVKAIDLKKIRNDGLDCDYGILFSQNEADELLKRCEEEIDYYTGDLTKVRVYGKWHQIPRKQVAFGDDGLSYKFSGTTVPAKPWTPLMEEVRSKITEVTGHRFNFVLVNRYKDGDDYMGEHRDDEKELVEKSPIASLTLGQPRDFVFRHSDTRGRGSTRKIEPVKILLEHGCLLMMNYPTNKFWYHSLPKRKGALGVRINMTFRQMVTGDPKVTQNIH